MGGLSNMTLLVPLGHRVLVKPIVIEEKTKGGIYLPQQSIDLEKAGIDKGEVVAIGDTAWKDERLGGKAWCKVGDNVIWARYAGKPVTINMGTPDEITYHLVNDEDILGREEET